MKLFKHKDVIRIYPDLKTRTLISWSEKGLFTPEIEASGTGTRRQYSARNLVEIGVIRELVSYRFSHEMIRPIILALEKGKFSENNGHDFVIVLRRQYSPGLKGAIGYVLETSIGSRSGFANDAGRLVFGEGSVEDKGLVGKRRLIAVGSAIIVSVAGIWEFIKERL